MKRHSMLLCFVAIMVFMTTAVRSEIVLNVKDFGAVGNGVTDDSAAIQQAIAYAFANSQDLYFPTATYAIGTTLIIPQYFNYTIRSIRINCGHSTFKLLANTTLFTSGYYNNGVLVSNFGTPDDSHYSSGIILGNFQITSNVGTLTATALKIQDWHQGSTIQNINSIVSEVILQSHNNYYTQFDNICTMCTSSGARFDFSGAHNLNKFTRLQAAGAAIGYRFGAVTACQFSNNSIEGVGIGLQFNSSVYDIVIENNYCEGFSDVAIEFNDYVYAATIRNNYAAFGNNANCYFVDYLPLPLNNIVIDSDNTFVGMPSEANVIKTLDDLYSAGVVIRRSNIGTDLLDALIVPNSIYSSKIDWQQKVIMSSGMRANVVNKYAVGNYSGKYTEGFTGGAHGFNWVNTSNSTLRLTTKILPSSTQRIYVNIYVYASGGGNIVGEFIGSTFYQYGATGISVTTTLSVSTVDGYIQINGSFAGTVGECIGEVRLI